MHNQRRPHHCDERNDTRSHVPHRPAFDPVGASQQVGDMDLVRFRDQHRNRLRLETRQNFAEPPGQRRGQPLERHSRRSERIANTYPTISIRIISTGSIEGRPVCE